MAIMIALPVVILGLYSFQAYGMILHTGRSKMGVIAAVFTAFFYSAF